MLYTWIHFRFWKKNSHTNCMKSKKYKFEISKLYGLYNGIAVDSQFGSQISFLTTGHDRAVFKEVTENFKHHVSCVKRQSDCPLEYKKAVKITFISSSMALIRKNLGFSQNADFEESFNSKRRNSYFKANSLCEIGFNKKQSEILESICSEGCGILLICGKSFSGKTLTGKYLSDFATQTIVSEKDREFSDVLFIDDADFSDLEQLVKIAENCFVIAEFNLKNEDSCFDMIRNFELYGEGGLYTVLKGIVFQQIDVFEGIQYMPAKIFVPNLKINNFNEIFEKDIERNSEYSGFDCITNFGEILNQTLKNKQLNLNKNVDFNMNKNPKENVDSEIIQNTEKIQKRNSLIMNNFQKDRIRPVFKNSFGKKSESLDYQNGGA